MALIPTAQEEDAKRPNREREGLVGERTRIVNRMKSTPCSPPEPAPLFQPEPAPGWNRGAGLARLGIRGFEPTLRRAPERLARLLTPEGMTLPPNTLAELGRDMARLRFVAGRIRPDPARSRQIREIEEARLKRLDPTRRFPLFEAARCPRLVR